MCSKNNSNIWSSNALCSFGVGGYCNETLNKCECYGDFLNDLTLYRQRDCSMNKYAISIIFGLVIFSGLLCIATSINKVLNSAGTARIIMVTSLFYLFHCFLCNW